MCVCVCVCMYICMSLSSSRHFLQPFLYYRSCFYSCNIKSIMAFSSSSNRSEVTGITGRQEDIRTGDTEHRTDYMMYLIPELFCSFRTCQE